MASKKEASQFLAFAYRCYLLSLSPRGLLFTMDPCFKRMSTFLMLVPLYQVFDQAKHGIALSGD